MQRKQAWFPKHEIIIISSLFLLTYMVPLSAFVAEKYQPQLQHGIADGLPRMLRKHSKSQLFAKLSESDKDRLLLGEEGLTAFIVAEMRHFVNATMVELDVFGTKWEMPDEEKVQMGLMNETGSMISEDYSQAEENMKGEKGGAIAVDLICNVTRQAFQDGFREQGLLSALGSAIMYFRNYYRNPRLIAACERIGISDYTVAHHITDMYHHRIFRGAYTKTLAPSGKGEIAARIAVGLDREDSETTSNDQGITTGAVARNVLVDENDECLLWSPTNPDVCIHWKSDDEKWRKTRFERIQMEGTKDPRRGGSGTTR